MQKFIGNKNQRDDGPATVCKDLGNGVPLWIRRQSLNEITWFSRYGKVGDSARIFYDGSDNWRIVEVGYLDYSATERLRYVVARR